jgi:hypothetical protein
MHVRQMIHTCSIGFGWRVDADKDEVGLPDGIADVGREVKILAPALSDNVRQAGFIYRENIRIPLLQGNKPCVY